MLKWGWQNSYSKIVGLFQRAGAVLIENSVGVRGIGNYHWQNWCISSGQDFSHRPHL